MANGIARSGFQRAVASTVAKINAGVPGDEIISSLARSLPGLNAQQIDQIYGAANQAVYRGLTMSTALNDLAGGQSVGQNGLRPTDKEVVVTVTITDPDGSVRYRTVRIGRGEVDTDQELLDKINSVIDSWRTQSGNDRQQTVFTVSYVLG